MKYETSSFSMYHTLRIIQHVTLSEKIWLCVMLEFVYRKAVLRLSFV